MISKEKLLNGYIENDQGELRRLFVNAAKKYGYEVTEGVNWLDWEFIYVDEHFKEVATGTKVERDNKLTLEDFVDTPSETTKQGQISVLPNKEYTKITAADIQGLRDASQDDVFKRILSIAKENNLFIQFDGFTQDENDTIVVTHAYSDTEYVIETQEQFNQLVESFNVLEKFERK